METQIGGGLIEEVIQVAEGELQLVDAMAKSQVLVMPILILRTKNANLLQMGGTGGKGTGRPMGILCTRSAYAPHPRASRQQKVLESSVPKTESGLQQSSSRACHDLHASSPFPYYE